MTSLAACNHGVVGLIAVVLVIEVDQECTDLGSQVAVVIARAELPGAGFFRFDFIAGNAVRHLAVLHAAERAFGVGVQVPGVGEVVKHIQRWQCGAVVALIAGVGQIVVLRGVDHLVANAGRDGPLADVDTVINVERMRFSRAAGVTVVAAGGSRQVAGHRFAIAQFVTRFVDVAVADAHFMPGLAQCKALREARFQTAYPIFAGR